MLRSRIGSAESTETNRRGAAIQRALAWYERQRDAHGLVADSPYWHFMDWSAFGGRARAAAHNAVIVGALRAASALAGALGCPGARCVGSAALRAVTGTEARAAVT